MAYIGNQPFTTAFLTDQFSGTGSQTAFTLSAAPANTNSLLVAVTGVLQDPSTYSVNGTTLTFSAAPPSGTANISVRFLGIPASGVTTTAYRTLTEFTATAGQTTFTPPSYTVGFLNVYRNGVLLGTADYTASNGTTVVLVNPASAGDLVVTESFYVSSVLNAIANTAGSVSTANIADNAITTAKIAVGAVIPADLSTGAPSWDTSGNLSFNSGYGSNAVAYGCRAWISFNGTGTPAIRGSGNVTSISDRGTGYYTINLTTALTDTNYAFAGGAEQVGGDLVVVTKDAGVALTTSGVPINVKRGSGSADVDSPFVFVAIFR
jgi:hypothetical protein